MARGPISKVPAAQRKQLLDDLKYLNESEVKGFCKQHSIPFRIVVENRDGSKRNTNDEDRKGVILDRIRHFLETGDVLAQTCFRASVVCFDPLPDTLTEEDRLYYGQYDKTSPVMIGLLQELTDGQFRSGAIARILAREFWTAGVAPTFREYATAWLEASRTHTAPNPEWAFLSERARHRTDENWEKMRAVKATKVLSLLDEVCGSSGASRKRTPGRLSRNR